MKNSYTRTFVAVFCLIVLSGCVGIVKDKNGSTTALPEAVVDQKVEKSKRFIYVVVPDGMQVNGVTYDVVDNIGCNDTLVRIEDDTLTSPVQALEKMLVYNDPARGYYNSLSASQLNVVHVMTDEDGGTNVFLTGQLRIGGVCDVPRIQAQLERTVQQYNENSLVHIFVNDVPLEDLLSEK